MRLSVTARIALLSVALALVSNLLFAAVVWKQAHDTALDAVERETIEKSDAMRAVWQSGGLPALERAFGEARAPGDESLLLAALDGQGRHIAGYAPRHLGIPLVVTTFRSADVDETGEILDAGYALQPIGRNWLLVGRTLDLVEAQQHAIERALALAVALSLLMGVLAAIVLTRYVGRRLDAIGGVVMAAGEGDLSRRVATVARGQDAFDRLSARLNVMLDKIERLMGELRLVTDSLAHDLRSPLTRLRTRTENALLLADPAQRDAALGGLMTETDLVMRMLSTLIEISRAEAVTRDRFVLLAPGDLVEELGELYDPVAEEAGLAFVLAIDDQPPPTLLHRELLSQAITNMLDNAIRHGPAGGEITLRLASQGAAAVIQVEDRGPGIPPEDRAQALRRFGRLDSARSTPGAGLGLALIEAVARLHDGRFELGDNAPGLVARLVLPLRQ